jgi:soluble lytic murein transglycosylase-like protein
VIYHYKWSPKRSLAIVAVFSMISVAYPLKDLSPGSGSFSKTTLLELTQKISRMHQVDPRLVRAIIHVESSGNPSAVSSAGATGLMGVMPASARMVGLQYRQSDLKNPEKNIIAGIRIYKYYQRGRTLRQALHLYSGGAKDYYSKVLRAKEGLT